MRAVSTAWGPEYRTGVVTCYRDCALKQADEQRKEGRHAASRRHGERWSARRDITCCDARCVYVRRLKSFGCEPDDTWRWLANQPQPTISQQGKRQEGELSRSHDFWEKDPVLHGCRISHMMEHGSLHMRVHTVTKIETKLMLSCHDGQLIRCKGWMHLWFYECTQTQHWSGRPAGPCPHTHR